MSQELYEFEMRGSKPTLKEAEILLKAQGEVIREGSTSKLCPRCGKFLRYTWQHNLETTRCMDIDCIVIRTRGI